jgi:hypothetical protein
VIVTLLAAGAFVGAAVAAGAWVAADDWVATVACVAAGGWVAAGGTVGVVVAAWLQPAISRLKAKMMLNIEKVLFFIIFYPSPIFPTILRDGHAADEQSLART